MPESYLEHILIKQLIRGDASAFDKIYDRYNERVYAFSLSNLRNREDAEGVVQEVFLNLWKDRIKLKEIRNLDAWLFTISFNIIRKRFRKLAREKKVLSQLGNQELEDTTSLTETEYNDLLDKAEEIIQKLPPRQKNIYVLSKKSGLSNREISEKLHISKKTVENNLSKAKAFLKKAFVDESLLTIMFFWLFLR
jgi:RNA polymerase sigma-70 factor (ECF subfamily)